MVAGTGLESLGVNSTEKNDLMKSIAILLITLALPFSLWGQIENENFTEVRWGGRDGVEIIERDDAEMEILQDQAPVPADQIRREEDFIQVFGADGELNLEMRLGWKGQVLWVWNPAYGDYGRPPQIGGIDPASVIKADQRLGLDQAQGGFYVKSVKRNSSAALAGLQPYDQVIAIAGQPLASPVGLAEALQSGPAQLTVLRDGETLHVTMQQAY